MKYFTTIVIAAMIIFGRPDTSGSFDTMDQTDLRDYFVGQLILGKGSANYNRRSRGDVFAISVYGMADSLIRARNK